MPLQAPPTIGTEPIQKVSIKKPKLIHAETALLLAKVKTLAEKADDTEGAEMYVYNKEGVKITL